MQIWILASFFLGLMLFGGLLFFGRRHVLGSLPVTSISKSRDSDKTPAELPRAAVIIPVTGNTPGMQIYLESLLNQDYPDYETIFVTRDMKDAAVSIIQALLANGHDARHVTSGPASGCGQKNHNLLAGITTAGSSAEIMVFCDSSHQAPPHLLSDLIRPISKGDAVMTTGFHRIIPGDSGLATLGMLWSVLGIHLLQGITLFTQPWGGAMAIRRTVFEAHKVDRLWAGTVVDDFTMGPYLRKAGIICKPVPTACLTTPLAGQTIYEWNVWLTRQLLYMKFYTPGAWLAAAPATCLLVAPILLAAWAVIASLSGMLSSNMGLAGMGFLILFTGIGIGYRSLVPNPPRLTSWVATLYVLHFMTLWCYAKTWFTNTLTWKGISYRIAWKGHVKEVIIRPPFTGQGH